MNSQIINNQLYNLSLIEEWADGDTEWLAGFVELLLIEIPNKIIKINEARDNNNTKKLAYELHQLSSQLALLNNKEVDFLLKSIERKIKKQIPSEDINILIKKANDMIAQLKKDYIFEKKNKIL